MDGNAEAEKLIQKMEGDRSLSIEEFYRQLEIAANTLQERLELAGSDGVKLADL